MLTELSVRAGLTYRPADRPAQRPADRPAWTGIAGREAGGTAGTGGSGGSGPRQRTLMISIMIFGKFTEIPLCTADQKVSVDFYFNFLYFSLLFRERFRSQWPLRLQFNVSGKKSKFPLLRLHFVKYKRFP